jgi:hypothetical protein
MKNRLKSVVQVAEALNLGVAVFCLALLKLNCSAPPVL